jgi:hypothetical protein
LFAIRYPFPEIRDEVPKNFEWTDFFDPFSPWGCRFLARLRRDKTARQAADNAASRRLWRGRSVWQTGPATMELLHKKEHGVRLAGRRVSNL